MIENCLKNIIYCFYPKGIDNVLERERYLNSKELVHLFNFLNNVDVKSTVEKLEMEIKRDNRFQNIQDRSSLSFDRCLTFDLEIFSNNKLIRIVLEISVLFPYYYIYVTENQFEINPYKWITLPKRCKVLEEEYSSEITSLMYIVDRITGYSPITDDIMNMKIDDVSFQDVEKGNFTVYNAFFKDELI